MKKDTKGNEYIEVLLPNDEAVRVSKIKKGWTGGECYRINLVDETNHVRQGAEFPKEQLNEVINALKQLNT